MGHRLIHDTVKIKLSSQRTPRAFAASEFHVHNLTERTQSTMSAAAQAARQRFLAQHGPGAELPRRPITPKAIRKALVHSEMMFWESL